MQRSWPCGVCSLRMSAAHAAKKALDIRTSSGVYVGQEPHRHHGGEVERCDRSTNSDRLAKRELNERLELGAELFAHGREGFAAAQTERSAMVDVGGYYHFKHQIGRAHV